MDRKFLRKTVFRWNKILQNQQVKNNQEDFKSVNVTLIEDEVDLERYTSKKKAIKEPKKSTVQEPTNVARKEYHQEIAAIRKLTSQTIGSHIAKLIESGTIAITAVLPEDKLFELEQAFKGYKEEMLNGLKDNMGEKIQLGRIENVQSEFELKYWTEMFLSKKPILKLNGFRFYSDSIKIQASGFTVFWISCFAFQLQEKWRNFRKEPEIIRIYFVEFFLLCILDQTVFQMLFGISFFSKCTCHNVVGHFFLFNGSVTAGIGF